MLAYIVLDVATGVAIDQSSSLPVFTERGLELDEGRALSFATEQNTGIVRLELPADFVGGKYMFDGTGLVANPAYILPNPSDLVVSVNPDAVRQISKNAFYDRLGDDLPAIYTLAWNNVHAAIWLDRLKMAPESPDGLSVSLDDPKTIQGVQGIYAALETVGAIAAGQATVRAAEVLI